MHLDVRGLLLLPKSQPAQEVEESADLLRCQVVHVVQGSLCQTEYSLKNKNACTNTSVAYFMLNFQGGTDTPLLHLTDCYRSYSGRMNYWTASGSNKGTQRSPIYLNKHSIKSHFWGLFCYQATEQFQSHVHLTPNTAAHVGYQRAHHFL